MVSRVAGGAAYGGSLEAWRALCEVHGWSEARCGGALPDAWQAVGQDDAPDGVLFVFNVFSAVGGGDVLLDSGVLVL